MKEQLPKYIVWVKSEHDGWAAHHYDSKHAIAYDILTGKFTLDHDYVVTEVIPSKVQITLGGDVI